jgi:hypothetical protein
VATSGHPAATGSKKFSDGEKSAPREVADERLAAPRDRSAVIGHPDR